jgi:hypothetical protein
MKLAVSWKSKFGSGAATLFIHAAALAAIATAIAPSTHSHSKLGTKHSNSIVSLILMAKPTIETQIRATAPMSTKQIAKPAAGPIASQFGQTEASIAHRPKQLINELPASIAGTERVAKLLSGLIIDDAWIPPHLRSIRVKIWIDESGLATKAELLTELRDPEAEKVILAAILEAIYFPAEQDGKTIDSIAELEFARSEAEVVEGLIEPSSVVTPGSHH